MVWGLGLFFLFVLGARNYVESVRSDVTRELVRLEFASEPSGADVVSVRDGRILCVAPCAVGVDSDRRIEAFRFQLAGHASRQVMVDMGGGDARIEAVLLPR